MVDLVNVDDNPLQLHPTNDFDRAKAQALVSKTYRTALATAWIQVQYDIGAQSQLMLSTSTTNVVTPVVTDIVNRLTTYNFTVSTGVPFVDPNTNLNMTPITVVWS